MNCMTCKHFQDRLPGYKLEDKYPVGECYLAIEMGLQKILVDGRHSCPDWEEIPVEEKTSIVTSFLKWVVGV